MPVDHGRTGYTVEQREGPQHLRPSHGLCLVKMFKWLLGSFLQYA